VVGQTVPAYTLKTRSFNHQHKRGWYQHDLQLYNEI